MKSKFTFALLMNELKCLLFVVKKEQYRVAREIEALEICDSCDEAWCVGGEPLSFLLNMENRYIAISHRITELLNSGDNELSLTKENCRLVYQLLLSEQDVARPEQRAADDLLRDGEKPPECFIESHQYRFQLNSVIDQFNAQSWGR